MPEDYRPLTPNERAILDRLLDVPFEGRDEAREQLQYLTARRFPGCEEHCGSLELIVGDGAPLIPHDGDGESKIDAEGWVTDGDGVPVEIILFQKQGRMSYLEFVVYSDRLKRQPNAADVQVWSTRDIRDAYEGKS